MFKVQWYPGHMTKAKRKIENIIKTIDIIIELRDARIPLSSGNPDISKMALGKGHLIILTKPDLADKTITEEWIELFKEKELNMITIKGTDTQDVKKIIKHLEIIADKVFEKRRKKGLLDRPVRCMVLGVSNVGKSSLINSLALKRVAVTGNKPGVTKGNQWVTISKKIELLDTPGILWPKFDGLVGVNLALTGAISDNVYDIVEAACYLIQELKNKKYLETINEPYDELKSFGEKRGILLKGGMVDLEKSAILFLKDYRSGKIGKITLEWPENHEIK
ncbi:MAG: ribosome biogenesis GTPase YlqF [Firmicutes bacterium]|nr:ribosome biogenesis GTPase YlqF [Bacillota bacterium]